MGSAGPLTEKDMVRFWRKEEEQVRKREGKKRKNWGGCNWTLWYRQLKELNLTFKLAKVGSNWGIISFIQWLFKSGLLTCIWNTVLFTKFSLDSFLFLSSNSVLPRDLQIQHSKTQLFVIGSKFNNCLNSTAWGRYHKWTRQGWGRIGNEHSHSYRSHSPRPHALYINSIHA